MQTSGTHRHPTLSVTVTAAIRPNMVILRVRPQNDSF